MINIIPLNKIVVSVYVSIFRSSSEKFGATHSISKKATTP